MARSVRTWSVRTWAALAVVSAALMPSADAVGGAYGCWEDFGPVDERAGLGAGRPGQAAERALAQARRFPGDRHLGRLRWAVAHPETGTVSLGAVKGGVVTVSLPAEPSSGRERPVVGALRVSDGAVLWTRMAIGAPLWTTDAVGPPDLITVDTSKRLAALDITTGRGLWCGPRSDLRSEIDNDTLVTEHGDALDIGMSITSLHARTGARRWRVPLAPETIATGAGVLVGDTDRNPDGLSAHRLSDGTRLWFSPDPHDQVDGVIGVAADRVLIKEGHASHSLRIVALDLGTGRRLWSRDFGTLGTLTVRLVDDRLLIADNSLDDSRLHALRTDDGSSLWSARVPGGLDPRYGARHRGRLYIPDDSGGLRVLDTSRGTVSRTLTDLPWPPPLYPTDHVASENDVTVGDGVLVVQIQNLTLAFDLPR